MMSLESVLVSDQRFYNILRPIIHYYIHKLYNTPFIVAPNLTTYVAERERRH